MFEHEKSYFLANSKIKSFYILLYNGGHMMSLKYDNFRFLLLKKRKNSESERSL